MAKISKVIQINLFYNQIHTVVQQQTLNFLDHLELLILLLLHYYSYSAFNNLVLAKILHHFYLTRLSEIRIESMEKYLVPAVRDYFKLYKSTTQLAVFLPRNHGGLGVKKLSFVYYTIRIAFLVNSTDASP